MAWIGKVGGGLIGLVVGGPVGAAIGAAIGHQFDRGTTEGNLLPGDRATSAPDRRRLFFAATFRALGASAKADGRVSEDEIASARALMREFKLGPDDVQQAIGYFTEGKVPGYPVERDAAALAAVARGYPELLRTFLEIQVDYALANGGPTPPQRVLLERIAVALGVSGLDLVRLESLLRARRSFRERTRGPAEAGAGLAAAYRALGVEPTASDKAVKDAYRRLVNQHHPDKQAARGLPESMREVAKERTREILAAYELIRGARGLK